MKDQNNYFSQSPESLIRKQLKLYKKQRSKKSGSEIAPWQQYLNQMGKASSPTSPQQTIKNIKILKKQILQKDLTSINVPLKSIPQIEKKQINKINESNQKIIHPINKLIEISQQIIQKKKNLNQYIKTSYQSKDKFNNKNKNILKYKKYGYQAIKNMKNNQISQNLSLNNIEQNNKKITQYIDKLVLVKSYDKNGQLNIKFDVALNDQSQTRKAHVLNFNKQNLTSRRVRNTVKPIQDIIYNTSKTQRTILNDLNARDTSFQKYRKNKIMMFEKLKKQQNQINLQIPIIITHTNFMKKYKQSNTEEIKSQEKQQNKKNYLMQKLLQSTFQPQQNTLHRQNMSKSQKQKKALFQRLQHIKKKNQQSNKINTLYPLLLDPLSMSKNEDYEKIDKLVQKNQVKKQQRNTQRYSYKAKPKLVKLFNNALQKSKNYLLLNKSNNNDTYQSLIQKPSNVKKLLYEYRKNHNKITNKQQLQQFKSL